MIVPAAVLRKHGLVRPYLDDAATRVRDVVRGYCESEGYAYLGRTKDSESLAEKLETGRFARWSEVDDLFACSVIVPTLADESPVLVNLRNWFLEVNCRQRGSVQNDPATFRFDATRFTGRLQPSMVPSASEQLLGVTFEIQIRTAFEHAWSVTTHALAYKSPLVDWRRLRLAAQLKSAVEQLDQVVSGFALATSFITDRPWQDVAAKQAIQTYFETALRDGRMPSEVAPSSWMRFCENLHRVILASTDRRVRDQLPLIESALGTIGSEIDTMDRDEFPRSISLLQFCVGTLAKHGFVTGPLNRYTPLLTSELLNLYPQAKALGSSFDFEFDEGGLMSEP